MKLTFVILFVFSVIFKSFTYSAPLSQLQSHEKFKREIENEVALLTKPLLVAAENLRQQVDVYQEKHNEAVMYPPLTHFDINTAACNNLSKTLVAGGQLAWNATLSVYHMTLNVTDTLGNLTGCIGWNPIDAAKCYVDSITNVIQTVRSIKPTIMKTLKEIINISSRLEPEFLACIGDEPTTTTELQTTTTEQLQTTKLISTTSQKITVTELTTTTARSWWPW